VTETLTFDPALAYPSYDKPFLESWNGRFESVFVALHPFFQLPGTDPYAEGYAVSSHTSGISARNEFSASEDAGFKNLPGKLGEVMGDARFIASLSHPKGTDWLAESRALSWTAVAEETGLQTRERVGTALLAMIGAIRGKFPEEVSRLVGFCERTKTFPPSEGSFQPLHFASFLDLFKRAGSQVVMFQEEFDDRPVLDLAFSEFEPNQPYRGSLYSTDKSALIVVDWDSYFTLVAGPRALLEPWVEDHALDGFFADKTTTHHWWVDPAHLN
jgi:hypothetical protein